MSIDANKSISKHAEEMVRQHFRRFGINLVDEPNLGGKLPDFGVVDSRGALEAVIEVESIVQETVDSGGVVCLEALEVIEPIRDQIEHARNHFKHARRLPCLLVIDASSSPFFHQDPSTLMEAMLGTEVFRVAVYEDGSSVGGLATASDGKVSRPHWRTPQNTTISAIGVFLTRAVQCQLTEHNFDGDGVSFDSLPSWMRAAVRYEAEPIPDGISGPCTLVCNFPYMQVIKNPNARIEWPSHLIGPWDDVFAESDIVGQLVKLVSRGGESIGAPEEAIRF